MFAPSLLSSQSLFLPISQHNMLLQPAGPASRRIWNGQSVPSSRLSIFYECL